MESSTEEKKNAVSSVENITFYYYDRGKVSQPVGSQAFRARGYRNRNFMQVSVKVCSFTASDVSFGVCKLYAGPQPL